MWCCSVQVEEDGKRYWRNEKLGVSSWKDPRRTTNLFQVRLEPRNAVVQAALDGNLFFLQLYTEVGGFLDAAGGLGALEELLFDAWLLRWTAKAARHCTITVREAPPRRLERRKLFIKRRCTICCSMAPVWTSWTARAPRPCIGRPAMATPPSFACSWRPKRTQITRTAWETPPCTRPRPWVS